MEIYKKIRHYICMTSLINKSNHPVNIKKINVRIWTLRDEIEACIQKRIEEQGADNVDIEDIKSFYSQLRPRNFSEDDLDDPEGSTNFQPGVEDTSEIEESEEQASDSDENEEQDSTNETSEQAKELASEVLEGKDKQSSFQNGFKRVTPSEDKMTYGFAFLSEIHMEQILFFGKKPYTNGQTVIIEFLIPNDFSMSAEIQNSMPIDRGSRIISQTKPSHRVQGSFLFLFDGERNGLRNFLKSVEPEVPPPPRKLKQVDNDEDDEDDFDDLGF